MPRRTPSRHTRTDLEQFAEYVGPQGWSDIDHVLIRGYLSRLYERGLSKTSVARALAALRSLYRWLAQEGVVEQNPAALVATPKLPKKLPRVPTIEEMNTVLDAEHAGAARRSGARPPDPGTALRLRHSQLGADRHQPRRRALVERSHPGARQRDARNAMCPFGDSAAKSALPAYLPVRQQRLGETRQSHGEALLVNLRGTRLTTRSVGRIVKRIAVAVRALTRCASAHPASRLRHAHAGRRRRPARHPGDARPRAALHHAALHAAHREACDGGVRPDPSACEETSN